MKNDISIVVVGLGNIARRHRRNLRQIFPHGTIIAVSASGRVPQETICNADKVVSSIDAALTMQPAFAIVASPASHHYENSAQFINAGVPVLIEKPLTACSHDADQLKNLVQKANTTVAVAYCLRYLPSAAVTRQLLDDGDIGHIHNAQITIGQFLPDWRPTIDYRQSVSAQQALGGGVLLELSHELDYLQWLLGPQQVLHAVLRNSRELDLEVEEIADVVMESRRGTISSLHMDFIQKQPCRRSTFIGSKARLEWDLIANSVTRHGADGSICRYSQPDWDKNGMYLAMLEDFMAAIAGKPNNSTTLDEAIATVQLVEQIKKIAIQGNIQ